MNKTGIEWCDYTWNPITGCSPISEGCANCYAEDISRRFGYAWGAPVYHPERLPEPMEQRPVYKMRGNQLRSLLAARCAKGWPESMMENPLVIFALSMSDFGLEIHSEWRYSVIGAMNRAPMHCFILLTKRPGLWMVDLPANAWIGVSIESDKHQYRLEALNGFPRKNHMRIASVEPMLGPVSFDTHVFKPSWVICGPETGRKARPCDSEWIEDLAVECQRDGIPFFDKRPQFIRREFPQ